VSCFKTLWCIYLCRYGLNGLRKGDEYPTYTLVRSIATIIITFAVTSQIDDAVLICFFSAMNKPKPIENTQAIFVSVRLINDGK